MPAPFVRSSGKQRQAAALWTGAALLIATTAFAQQQAPPPLTERVEVSVVNVDVTVLDSAGKPVNDLKADDFQVSEDGKPQKITNFSAVVNAAPKPKAEPAPLQEPARCRRRVLVMVDEMSVVKPRRIQAIKGLQKFVDERFRDGDEWSVVLIGWESRTLLPFTSDRAAIATALKRAEGGIPPAGSEARLGVRGVERGLNPQGIVSPGIPSSGGTNFGAGSHGGRRISIDTSTSLNLPYAVIHASRAMAAFPGKKAILLVTGYIPGYEKPSFGDDEQITLAQAHAAMVRAANSANVNIFVLDPLGVGGNFDEADRLTAASYWLSEETGGSYLRSNDMPQSLARFDVATTNYYELGYPTSVDDNKYHRITVQVNRPGRYTIKHREGYVRVPQAVMYERAFTSPVTLSSWPSTLPVSFEIGEILPAKEGRSIVPLMISVPIPNLLLLQRGDVQTGRVHVYITVFDEQNRPVTFQHLVETLTIDDLNEKEADLVVARTLPLKSGLYRIFVTARDELTDDVGIVSKEVKF